MSSATLTACSSTTLCQIPKSNALCCAKGRAGRPKVASLNPSFDTSRIYSFSISHQRSPNASKTVGIYCTSSGDFGQDYSYTQPNQQPGPLDEPTPEVAPERNYSEPEPNRYQYLNATAARRRPYNLEAKMRMKAYRRQAQQQQRQMALDEEARNFEITLDECYKKGDPNTVDGIITEITHIGVVVRLPNGRDGFLPATQLGCMGSLALMERLFRVGEEISVRVIQVPQPHGKDRLFLKK